jgi:hypothetical protein
MILYLADSNEELLWDNSSSGAMTGNFPRSTEIFHTLPPSLFSLKHLKRSLA